MPWGSAMERRELFVRLAVQPGANVSELARRFEVSRSNAYKWLKRHAAEGEAGLAERSRRPHESPGRTTAEMEARVVALRRTYPAWGGRKLCRVLQNQGFDAPSPSTITAILRRHDLLDGPRAGMARDFIRFEHEAPNDLWQMDFKGHVALAEGRCHPLTILDDHSRYALEIGACSNERTGTVRERLTAVFRHYGLPRRILSDNGPPWGTGGSLPPFTVLTVWLMDLDIEVRHGRPLHPQTQGKDERFHRSLVAEVLAEMPADKPFRDLVEAQRAFDHWRTVYNTIRPHEGIQLATPSDRYRMSPRAMPEAIAPPQYETGVQLRKVQSRGEITFHGRTINCSKAFAGRQVALRATEQDGVFDICYRSLVLAQVDLRQNTP